MLHLQCGLKYSMQASFGKSQMKFNRATLCPFVASCGHKAMGCIACVQTTFRTKQGPRHACHNILLLHLYLHQHHPALDPCPVCLERGIYLTSRRGLTLPECLQAATAANCFVSIPTAVCQQTTMASPSTAEVAKCWTISQRTPCATRSSQSSFFYTPVHDAYFLAPIPLPHIHSPSAPPFFIALHTLWLPGLWN